MNAIQIQHVCERKQERERENFFRDASGCDDDELRHGQGVWTHVYTGTELTVVECDGALYAIADVRDERV